MRPRIHPLFYCLLSSAILSVSWYWDLAICAFAGFAPLLVLEDYYRHAGKTRQVFLHSYLTFLLWNIGVTWWVVYASFGGALMAFIFNALFMALVFTFYSRLRQIFPQKRGAWLIIPVWICWEHLHTLWDLAWTWLTLGNVFSSRPHWIQWYEITGTSGGTLWVLAANVILYQAVIRQKKLKVFSRPILRLALVIIAPIMLSYFILVLRLQQTKNPGEKINVAVVQPNIDPYNEKFDVDFTSQFNKILRMVRGHINDKTDYLVLPETFIATGMDENTIQQAEEITLFRDSIINKYPGIKVVAGGNTYITYDNDATSTARFDKRGGIWYDVYNTGLMIDKNSVAVYHKSKLVPGVERMPFPALFKPLESLAIDMGGTVGSLGTQESRQVFMDTLRHTGVAPVICYESVFADYVTAYVRNGANVIFIITNDGWWDDTPGYHQHLRYARLRAIENRRDIARSANTGISCFIDRFGNVSEPTLWWKEAVITKAIYLNNELTFFSRYGDIISYMSLVFTLLLIMWLLLASWPGRLLKFRGYAAGKKP
jgi:apolipoprotein N-acyltransferase